MSSRDIQIDSFLKRFRDIAKENPNINFDTEEAENMIYHYLVRLNVNPSNYNINLSEMGIFQHWINRFENIDNINCFVAENWKYFCQFKNIEERPNEYIKIYIPLDAIHIVAGASMIFDFLAKNNIKHLSKVGKHIRFDDIVVRLVNKDDAEKLAEFVENNKYIKEGLISPNPFAYSKNNIAYAVDGSISYNNTVAKLINLYIQQRKSENKLDTIDTNDFYGFVIYYYNNVFSNMQNVSRFQHDFSTNSDEYENYKQVVELIIRAHNPQFTFDDYIQHFESCNDSFAKKNEVTEETEKIVNVDLESTLLELLNKMSSKYGRRNTIDNINKYLIDGMPTRITRIDDLRTRVTRSNFRQELLNALQKSALSLEKYICLVEEKNMLNIDKMQILISALLVTYSKAERISKNGRINMIYALQKLVFEGSYLSITRELNAREQVIKNFTQQEVIKLLQLYCNSKTNNSSELNDLCINFVDSVLKTNIKSISQ